MSPGKGRPPHDKKSFKSADRGKKAGGKQFGHKKTLEGRSQFKKKFVRREEKGNRFGQKKGESGKRFGGKKTFKGRATTKQQRGSGGRKDFKHKKGKS